MASEENVNTKTVHVVGFGKTFLKRYIMRSGHFWISQDPSRLYCCYGVVMPPRAKDVTLPPSPKGRARGSYAKSEARREDILAAAMEVFSTEGFRSGSLKDVALKVGLSQAGLLHHFPNKEALLEAVLSKRDESSLKLTHARDAVGADFLRGLIALVAYNATVPGMVALYCVLSAESTNPNHPAHDYFRRRYAWVRQSLTEAFQNLDNGDLLRPGVSPAAAARQLTALMDGLQVQWLLDPDSVDMGAEIKCFLNTATLAEF